MEKYKEGEARIERVKKVEQYRRRDKDGSEQRANVQVGRGTR
jgi:hypothetical protein